MVDKVIQKTTSNARSSDREHNRDTSNCKMYLIETAISFCITTLAEDSIRLRKELRNIRSTGHLLPQVEQAYSEIDKRFDYDQQSKSLKTLETLEIDGLPARFDQQLQVCFRSNINNASQLKLRTRRIRSLVCVHWKHLNLLRNFKKPGDLT